MLDLATDTQSANARTVERFFAAIQAGDAATLLEVLTPDAITRWPQSGEQITGAMACIRVYENYPGGPPAATMNRLHSEGELVVAELTADYGADRWWIVSVCEFQGPQIARMTDYFGPTLPAPEWRRPFVDPARD